MKPESIKKYRPFPAVELPDRQWPNRTITHAPIWASVDLRDGNQALPVPMSVEEKLVLFDELVRIGFKQIEVGFPSAADTEFNFLRALVDQNRIPDDVTVQVLVQAREHLIRRTFESLEGTKRAIVHLYNSTSPLQRRVTFGDASKESIRDIAVAGAELIKELVPTLPDTEITLQYSPESFSDTEPEYALEVCNAVSAVWEPNEDKKIILNLPATVEWTTPNVHADQIEWFCRHVDNREFSIISLHTHNDRGTGTAATELGLLAGADRVEGTLFGNGERTGNLDIVTVALNMNSHGIDTGLDFSDLSSTRQIYETVTRLNVPERHPYAGELVFTAFSGSHQDAIKKGFDRRVSDVEAAGSEDVQWGVPYLTIDPQDLGRSYEAIIRINSQSGKGGVAYVLDREHGYDLPKSMHPQVGKFVYDKADEAGRELGNDEIGELFFEQFVNVDAPMSLTSFELDHTNMKVGEVICHAAVELNGETIEGTGKGNGPINAFVHFLDGAGQKTFKVTDYRSQALRGGSDADSAAYVQIQDEESGQLLWGCGVDPSIEMAGLKALICAFNLKQKSES
ncbi:2-isopropylmalate synthase [Verrucomicrobiales bacterium BCK34]|nr:2-isopropylmalate synthase [Verrucomicrobiales bacterium BCK34]